jgi:hypothetical protein
VVVVLSVFCSVLTVCKWLCCKCSVGGVVQGHVKHGVLRNCVAVVYLVAILSFFIYIFFSKVFNMLPLFVLCRIVMLSSIQCNVCYLTGVLRNLTFGYHVGSHVHAL